MAANHQEKIGIAILGVTGFGGGEFLRLITQHPNAQVVSVHTTSNPGKAIDEVHPHLKGFYNLKLEEDFNADKLANFKHKIIISALPHGPSGKAIEGLHRLVAKQGIKVIDLSGDLRLKDETLHRQYYPHSEALTTLRKEAVFGLTEIHCEQIKAATLLSNPGCLATASILALAPLSKTLGSELIAVAVDAKTGSSGAGKTLSETTHHPQRHDNFSYYKAFDHQHEPEIVENIKLSVDTSFSFLAQRLPIARGIFVTAHAELKHAVEKTKIVNAFQEFYATAPFVRIRNSSPEIQNVVGSNFCDLAIEVRGKQLLIAVAIDNLVKGMVGQAIQNMNLMCGLDQTTGLWTPALNLS
ncbi:N-acetyl-gamma-glutamyl-phosphate reductase [bacterium]|nr:N-acetyl-gamma-glutamyl-phosphate reductase [bacterium]